MTGPLSLAASAVLVALGVWLLGGFVLRVGGAALAIGGLLVTASTGSPAVAVPAILGAVAWLAGQWLFAPSATITPLAASPPCLCRGAARAV